MPWTTSSANPSVTAANACNITVSNVEGQKSGLIFYSITGQAAVAWNASSFLCVKAPTQRTGTQTSGGTVNACDGTLTLDWNAFQAANPGALGQPRPQAIARPIEMGHARACTMDKQAPDISIAALADGEQRGLASG